MRNPTIAPYYGGKASHADKLLPLLCSISHNIYVEPFGGMAGLLLQKPPVKVDVYNDIDKALFYLFKCMRDEREALEDAIELTPYSREEYYHCLKVLKNPDVLPLELARATYCVLCMSFNGSLTNGGFSFQGPAYSGNVATGMHNTSHFKTIAARLRSVMLESRDWKSLITYWKSPKTLFYLDPPYCPTTRNSRGYRNEWKKEDHLAFAQHIADMGGCKFVLSCYDIPAYKCLKDAGWQRLSYPAPVMHAGDGRRRSKTESIYISPAALGARSTLFS